MPKHAKFSFNSIHLNLIKIYPECLPWHNSFKSLHSNRTHAQHCTQANRGELETEYVLSAVYTNSVQVSSGSEKIICSSG
jgi:hypothetical protein